MRLSALNRLRLAFCGIGALLLGPLGLLAHSVNERLEAQRRLRHEVVADRIFDELERELTAMLTQEFARPSSVYDAASIDAGGAVPYVLRYFTSADGRHNLLGGPGRSMSGRGDSQPQPARRRSTKPLGPCKGGPPHRVRPWLRCSPLRHRLDRARRS